MTQNLMNLGFRKVDIDKYGDNNFPEDNVPHNHSDQSISNFFDDLENILNGGNNLQALNLILDFNQLMTSEKERMVLIIIRILQTFQTKDIDSVLETLNSSQLDILMRYIYRGFEFPTNSGCLALLTWQEKVYNFGGLGCIIRALTNGKNRLCL